MKSSLKPEFSHNRDTIQAAYFAILIAQRDAKQLVDQINPLHTDANFLEGEKGEIQRLAEAAHSIVQFLNDTPFYEKSDEKKLELNPDIPQTPSTTQSSDIDTLLPALEEKIEAMRSNYLELLHLQQRVTNPYLKKPDPPIVIRQPRWWTRPIVRRTLAALIIVIIVLVAGNLIWNQLVASAYDRGIAALSDAAKPAASNDARWSDAINEFTFAYNDFRGHYKDSKDKLIISYQSAIDANYGKSDWESGRDLALRYYQTQINQSDATAKLRQGYFKPAQALFAAKDWAETRTALDGLQAAFLSSGVPVAVATPDSTGTQATMTALNTEEEQLYRDSYYQEALAISQKQPPDWDSVNKLLNQLVQRPTTTIATFDTVALDLLTTSYTIQAQTVLKDSQDAARWENARAILEPIGMPPLKSGDFQDTTWQTAYSLYLDTYYKPATMLLDNQKYDSARSEFAQLVTLQGGDQYQNTHAFYRDTFYQPATDLMKAEKYDDARKLLDQLIKLDLPGPSYLNSEFLRRDTIYFPAKAALDKGDYQTARDQFATLVNYDGKGSTHRDSDQLLLRAYYLPAEQAVRNEKWKDALDLLQKIYEFNPNYSNTVVLLTTTYYALGSDAVQHDDLSTAQHYLESLQEINPGFTGLQSLLSEVYYQRAETILGANPGQQQWDEARGFLLLLHKFNPGYRDARTLLKDSYYVLAQQTIATARDKLTKLTTASDQQQNLTSSIQETTKSARLLLNKLNNPNSGNFRLSIVLNGQQSPVLTGTINDASPVARFSFPAKQNDTVTLTATASDAVAGLDLMVDLQNPQQNTLISNDDATDSSVGELDSQIKDFMLPSNGSYTVVISRYTLSQSSGGEDIGLANYKDAQTLLHESYYIEIKAAIAVHNLEQARSSIESLSALSPYYKDIRSLFNLTYYDPAVAAIASQDWSTARDLLKRLLSLEPYYRDAFTLLRDAYYVPAQQALEAGRWDVARDALTPLLFGADAIDPQYKDASVLYKEAFYRPAVQAYDAHLWTIADQNLTGLQSALQQLDKGIDATANYGEAPKDLQTMLREVYYEPAIEAIKVKDWQTAQQNLRQLIQRIAQLEATPLYKADWGASPNNAQKLIHDVYYLPAVDDLAAHNWDSGRNNLNGLLDMMLWLQEYSDRGKANYQDAPNDVQTLLRESYYQPAVLALQSEDWQTARNKLDSLLDLIRTLEGKNRSEASYKDAQTLLRETYYRPAIIALKARDWQTARTNLNSLLQLVKSLKAAGDKELANYQTPPNDAQTLLRQSYLLPGEIAIQNQDWPVAQQTYQELVQIDPSYRDLLISAYLTPGQLALKNHDWGLARSYSQYILTELASTETEKTESQITAARQLFRDSYLQPSLEAYNQQDWAIARQSLLPLVQVSSPDPEAVNLFRNTYLTPVQNAIKSGDSTVARNLLLEFRNKFPNESSTYRDLLFQTYSIPLQDAVKRQDWFSAAEQLLSLRNQNLQDNSINLILLEYPDLNKTLSQRFNGYWTRASFDTRSALILKDHIGGVNRLGVAGTQLISGGTDGKIFIWNIGSGIPVFAIQTGQSWISDLVAEPRGVWIASIGDDSNIRIWDSESGQLIHEFPGHEGRINSLAVSPDGQHLASGGDDKTVRLWSSNVWGIVPLILTNTDRVTALQFSPDGKQLVAALANGDINIWDLDSDILKVTFKANGYIRKIIFSPDGGTFATIGNEPDIQLWSDNGNNVITLHGHTDWVRAASFSGNGALLATVSADNTLRIWNVQTGQMVSSNLINDPYDVQFAKDSSFLAVGRSDGQVILWMATQ